MTTADKWLIPVHVILRILMAHIEHIQFNTIYSFCQYIALSKTWIMLLFLFEVYFLMAVKKI